MQGNRFARALRLCCLALLSVSAVAQVRVAGTVIAMAPVGTSNTISLTASAPGGVQFNLVPLGVSPGNQPVSISASWDLVNSLDWVSFVAYFDDPTTALQAGINASIPSSAVSGAYTCVNAKGTLYSSGTGSFTSTVLSDRGPNASLLLMRQNINGSWKTSSSCTLNLSISLAGRPQQPAGTYTGTLHIVVRATP
jgi:hypothetical protein